jgi:GNAT superfamily N-acetyltransferase
MLRPLTSHDLESAFTIINAAALAYRGVIPDDCWQEPYMPREELLTEMAAGVRFWGYEAEGRLVGVMGRQKVRDVTLIRHAYVDPLAQRAGIGARLLRRLRQGVASPLLVGTWAAAWWAVRFYEKHGFRLVTPAEKDRLLRTYWTISDRQVETSVVLADETWFDTNSQSKG